MCLQQVLATLFLHAIHRSSFWRRQDIRWLRWGCRLGCEQLHKPWIPVDESTKSEIIISDISISLDFVACRVLRKHPSLRGANSIFFGRGNRWMSNRRMPWRLQWTHYVWPLPSLLVGWLMSNWAASCVWAASTLIRGVEDGHVAFLKMGGIRHRDVLELFSSERIKKLCDLHLPNVRIQDFNIPLLPTNIM